MIIAKEKIINGTPLPDRYEYLVLPDDVDAIDWNDLFKWVSNGEKIIAYILNSDKNSSKFAILQAYCGCKNIRFVIQFVNWNDYFSIEKALERGYASIRETFTF